jgi:hypothetical protein
VVRIVRKLISDDREVCDFFQKISAILNTVFEHICQFSAAHLVLRVCQLNLNSLVRAASQKTRVVYHVPSLYPRNTALHSRKSCFFQKFDKNDFLMIKTLGNILNDHTWALDDFKNQEKALKQCAPYL